MHSFVAFSFLRVPVQPSVFGRAARKRREEARGAEEVHEDENTATELPVDQVRFTIGVFVTALHNERMKCQRFNVHVQSRGRL